MSESSAPDYVNVYERYSFADPNLTETSYDSIKSLKERINRDDIDLKIDSHKGFLICEEPDCKFALKIRYGSSKGSVILGKSKYAHNHDPHKPKSFKRRQNEVLEKYYVEEAAKHIKLKRALEEIEKELGVPLAGDDLKKFKNKVYNIRQKIRREEEKKEDGAKYGVQIATPIPPPQPKVEEPPLKKMKREPLVKSINADEIKRIITESKNSSKIQEVSASVSSNSSVSNGSRGGTSSSTVAAPATPIAKDSPQENNLFLTESSKKKKDVVLQEPEERRFVENPIKLPQKKKEHRGEEESDKLNDRESSNRITQFIRKMF